MLNAEPSMFVFFYEEGDIFSRKVLRDLEKLDDRLDSLNIEIVKICDDGIDDDYELESLPSLVHFKKGQPSVYYGDLKLFFHEFPCQNEFFTNFSRQNEKCNDFSRFFLVKTIFSRCFLVKINFSIF